MASSRFHARGGVAVQILGAALFFLLLVGALGLVEARRALATRAEAQWALQAALQSAAASSTPTETFQWYLAQNLREQPFQATLQHRAAGEGDPLTGAPLHRSLLTGQLAIPYQIRWLGGGTPLTMHLSASVWQED
jgi:hypothetical protein